MLFLLPLTLPASIRTFSKHVPIQAPAIYRKRPPGSRGAVAINPTTLATTRSIWKTTASSSPSARSRHQKKSTRPGKVARLVTLLTIQIQKRSRCSVSGQDSHPRAHTALSLPINHPKITARCTRSTLKKLWVLTLIRCQYHLWQEDQQARIILTCLTSIVPPRPRRALGYLARRKALSPKFSHPVPLPGMP